MAYSILLPNWAGACVLGTIRPSFFLLPLSLGEQLGVPIYRAHDAQRDRRALQIGDWKDVEWPPEWIIQYYGPATWAEDGSWGYHTPIYMLNHIIRLQAVLKLITNDTTRALTILAQQQTKIHSTIHQNRLALDYLLASKERVCKKFNLNNCCLQIDDTGKVVEKIADRKTKLAHVHVQT